MDDAGEPFHARVHLVAQSVGNRRQMGIAVAFATILVVILIAPTITRPTARRRLQQAFTIPALMAVKAGTHLAQTILLSDQPVEAVRDMVEQLHAAFAQLGGMLEVPFMALSFLALPVVPHLKITEQGLVDVDRLIACYCGPTTAEMAGRAERAVMADSSYLDATLYRTIPNVRT